MNLKITPATLAKLEKIFEEAKYILRYEKGTFNSGYCILEHKRVVVINKFLTVEGRINTLVDILPAIELEEGFLTPESQKMYRQVMDNREGNMKNAGASEKIEAIAPAESTGDNDLDGDDTSADTKDETPGK